MKRFSFRVLATLIFSFLSMSMANAVLPLLGAGVVPVAGGFFSAKSASVKSTMNNVEVTLLYVRLFLLAMVLYFVCMLFVRAWRFFKRRRFTRKLNDVIVLFSRLHADLIYLKNMPSSAEMHNQSSNDVDCKKTSAELIERLLVTVKNDFFVRVIDYQLRKRIQDSLLSMQKGQVSLDDQIQLVDQWGRLMKRFSRT